MFDLTQKLVSAGWPHSAAIRIATALEPAPALVALDFDNTLIAGDVGETLHYAMCESLSYALDSELFWASIPVEVQRDSLRATWQNTATQPAAERVAAARAMGLDVELIAVFARHFAAFGARATFDWAATIFAGLTPDELRRIAAAAFEAELTRPIETVHATTADGIALRMNRGIRRCGAADALLASLTRANADFWLVSATNRWALEAISPAIGLRADRIIANGCHVTDGVITPVRDGPTTWHAGKVIAWQAVHGRPPDIMVGDSMSDAPLMRTATRLAILIDRGDERLAGEARERGWVIVGRELLGRSR